MNHAFRSPSDNASSFAPRIHVSRDAVTFRATHSRFRSMSDDDLFCAAQRGDLDASRRLLQQLLRENAPLSVFDSAMKVAIWNGHADIVREIVRLVPECETWARHLIRAARLGSTAAAQVLLQCCRGVLAENSEICKSALVCAAKDGNAATVALLIPHVTSVHVRAFALHKAAAAGCACNVRALILCRVDVNLPSWSSHSTALHSAARSGQTKVLKQLLHFKADIHSRTAFGHTTALELAAEEGHVAAAAVLRRRGNSLSVSLAP